MNGVTRRYGTLLPLPERKLLLHMSKICENVSDEKMIIKRRN